MKKMIFAVATALVVGFAASSCGGSEGGNEGDKFIQEYKTLAEKAEKLKKAGDASALLDIDKEAKALQEKYKDAKLTDEQKKAIEELVKKLE